MSAAVKNEASIEASGNESQQANQPQKPDFPEEWNKLLEKELATEKDRLADLKSDDYTGLIESAIMTISTAWLDAMKGLTSRSESKETQSIEIVIKKTKAISGVAKRLYI